MLVVVAGSHRPREKDYNFKGKKNDFIRFCKNIGRCLAEGRHTLWLAWSNNNIASQTNTPEKNPRSHPYSETADYYAFLGFIEALKNDPTLYAGENPARIRFLIAGDGDEGEDGEDIMPFLGYERQHSNVCLEDLHGFEIEKAFSDSSCNNGLRSDLLTEQAQSNDVDSFIVIGGGKATKIAAREACKKRILIPFAQFGGIGKSYHADESNLQFNYLHKMPIFRDHLMKSHPTKEDKHKLQAALILEQIMGMRHIALVITIRQDEKEAVDRLLGKNSNGTHLPDFRGRRLSYKMFQLTSNNNRKFLVASVRCSEQGPIEAVSTALNAIEDLHPILILVTGIAGGYPSTDYSLGDVIIGNRLHDFTVGQVSEGGRKTYINQGGPLTKKVKDFLSNDLNPTSLRGWNARSRIGMPRPTIDVDLISNYVDRLDDNDHLYGDAEWRKVVVNSLKTNFARTICTEEGQPKQVNKRKKPNFSFRANASNPNVVKDTQVVKTWEMTARDIASIEMEFGGVYAAANTIHKVYDTMTIRGISDIIGLKRDPEWTAYACKTAAAMTISVLLNISERFFKHEDP
jgi:nucleoside phosphorylase